jgi:hypothetical protein
VLSGKTENNLAEKLGVESGHHASGCHRHLSQFQSHQPHHAGHALDGRRLITCRISCGREPQFGSL